MKLLHPEFLFGLLAISIPIIVHLFNFRKAKKVYFSNTRFIREVKKSTSSKRRLKHLLILFARILFICFLVLAFAQPLIPSKTGGVSSENVYIYIDNSLSMTNSTAQGMTGLDMSLATVDKLTNIYPINTNYKILTNDFSPFSNTLKNRDEVKELITEIRRSHASRSLSEVYERLHTGLLGENPGKKEIYIISDFQKSGLGDPAEALADTLNNIYLVPIEFPQYGNVFVDTAYLENPFLMEAATNKLNVVLMNTGRETIQDMIVKLSVNGIQASSSSISIEPNSSQQTSFDLSMSMEAINKVVISFEDFPVTFDNEFYLVLNKSGRINILEIRDYTGKTPVESVYGNAELFNFRSHHVSNIDYSLIDQSDLVVLNGLSTIENTLSEALKRYIDKGEHVIIIPGSNLDVAAFQSIAGVPLQNTNRDEPQQLKAPDMSNPFFANIFDDQEGNIQMPVARPLVQWAGSRRDLLTFRNGQKYFSETREHIYLFSAPLTEDFGNMHRHALFVPIMYKIAADSKDSRSDLYYPASQGTFSIEMDLADNNSLYKLRTQESEYIPGQRLVGNRLQVEIPKNTLVAGFYDLYRENEYKNSIALNLDKSESTLDAYTQDELENIYEERKNISIFNTLSSDDVEDQVKELKFGIPLWKYALLFSLLFLLAEVLLIRFFK